VLHATLLWHFGCDPFHRRVTQAEMPRSRRNFLDVTLAELSGSRRGFLEVTLAELSGSRWRFLEVTLAELSGSRRRFLDVTLADISRSNSGEEWRFLEVTLAEISRSRPGGYFWKIFWRRFLEVIVLDVECVRAVGWQVVGPEHLPLLSSSVVLHLDVVPVPLFLKPDIVNLLLVCV